MNSIEYTRFEDFILDETFREFVEGSREESIAFWNTWILEHPEKSEEIRKARIVLTTLLSNHKEKVKTDKFKALDNLLSEIDSPRMNPSVRRYISSPWIRIAAVVLLSAGLAWLWHALIFGRFRANQKGLYNEIIVPVGEKSQIILSDGTHVWINSGSSFKYPVNFGQPSREVSLEGEAYFDVKKHGKSTFIVTTRDARIEVLGTIFDVKAYPEDMKTQTTVVRGLVRVQSNVKGVNPMVIRPDQMAVLNEIRSPAPEKTQTQISQHVVKKVNTTVITSWKDQMLVFADETFGDIAVKMERWFSIKVRIDDEQLKGERYTGKFVHNETVYEVLEAIKLTTPITYTVKDEEIVIKKKISQLHDQITETQNLKKRIVSHRYSKYSYSI